MSDDGTMHGGQDGNSQVRAPYVDRDVAADLAYLKIAWGKRSVSDVIRWSDLLAPLREIHVITVWADQTAEAILTAEDYPTDVGQWLALQGLAVHYRDHIRGHDHRWENLASGLTGVEP
ncbi:MAG: hypothetical protein WC343_12875 [Bacilli bacterium]|jgi:hypothetical protein